LMGPARKPPKAYALREQIDWSFEVDVELTCTECGTGVEKTLLTWVRPGLARSFGLIQWTCPNCGTRHCGEVKL